MAKKSFSLLIVLFFAWNISAQSYQSLDPKNPVRFSGDKIIYNGKTIALDENNIFLDGNLSDEVVKNHTFVFNNFADAVASLAETPAKKTIYIAPFVYWIDNPDDPEIRRSDPKATGLAGRGRPYGMTVKTQNLHLYGLNPNPENIVLASNRGQTQGAEGNFTMFHFLGDDLHVSNLTMGNYCNVDLEYPLLPSLNRARRAKAIVQAQLAICEGDRIWAENVRFISRLNTNPLSASKRSFFYKCYFESTDDALAPTGVYLGCRFTFFSSKPFAVTRGAGAVLLDCDINALGSRQYMVKVNSMLALVDVRFHHKTDNLHLGWIQEQDINPEYTYYQYNVTLNGNPVTMEGHTVDMTGKEVLNAYFFEHNGEKIYNTYNLLRGTDDFDPMNIKAIVEKEEKLRGYSLSQIPTSINIENITRKNIVETGKDTVLLQAKQILHHRTIKAEELPQLSCYADTSFINLTGLADNIRQITGKNYSEENREVMICFSTESGLQSAKRLTINPPTLPAPEFTREPTITRKGNELVVDYELDLQGRRDESLVSWTKSQSGSDDNFAALAAVSRNGVPLKTYHLSKSDAGKVIRVGVCAKSNRSDKGEIKFADIFIDEEMKSELPENIDTDFRNFPEYELQPQIKKGYWTVAEYRPQGKFTEWRESDGTSPWTYGFGIDAAAKSEGLWQKRRGALLLYTPVDESYGDMSLSTVLAPGKSAGQGFGSATGQYLEIYIKYDTQTKTGYGLRIIRTPNSDQSVDFILMQYTGGIATPISKAVTASAYRTNCTVKLSIKGNVFTASATTDSNHVDNRPNVAREVNLQAKITPNLFGGIGFQHTGTGFASATVIKHLSVDFGVIH